MQNGYTALDCAGNEQVKTALRKHGSKHSLFYAAEKGMLEELAALVATGADLSATNGVRLDTHTVYVYACIICYVISYIHMYV